MASKNPKTTRESSPPKTLRARAEALLSKTRDAIADMPAGDVQALVHELQVHQMELEIQNEELRHAQAELAESRDRFSDLYEFAPVGYLSLEADGKVLEANLTAATILGVTRRDLVGSNITSFVARDDQDGFYRHRQTVLSSEATHTWELTMRRADDAPLAARLESVAFRDGAGKPLHCRTALMDVTAQKQAEGWALQAERLKGMVENLPAGAVYVGDDRILMNRAAEVITGYHRDELRTRDQWFATLHGRGQEEARALYEEIREAGFLECSTFVIARHDGEEREIVFAAHGFDDHEVWFLRDVTERKQAENALKASEAEKNAILASLSAHIAVIDCTGKIVAVNPAWEKFARENGGTPAKCGRGANYLEACRNVVGDPQEEALGIADALEAILNGVDGAYSIEYPCHSAFEERWFILQATPLRGETPGAVVSHLEISDRIRAERALQREHDFSEKIIATEKLVVLVLDVEGRVVRFNPSFETLSGWRFEEAEGRDWFTTFLPKRERDRLAAQFKEALEGKHGDGNLSPVLTKEGAEILIEWHDAALTDDEGNVVGMLCTGIDVTERHILEQEVINAAEEERQRTAQDLHDGVGSLLTGIDFRVKALANVCATQKLSLTDEVTVISMLIRDAITQTRAIARGLHSLGGDPEDLMSALSALVTQASTTSNLPCRFQCRSPVLIEDSLAANHLFRIAQEALNNAIKHSDATHITVSLKQNDGQTILKVMDDGVGFDPHGTGSAGIGLHVMRYRARAINASLTIRHRKGGGMEVVCVFTIGH